MEIALLWKVAVAVDAGDEEDGDGRDGEVGAGDGVEDILGADWFIFGNVDADGELDRMVSSLILDICKDEEAGKKEEEVAEEEEAEEEEG